MAEIKDSLLRQKRKLKVLKRNCSVCGRKIKIIVYQDRSYRGGHYFGKTLPRNKEYWECPKCYW